MWSAPAGLAQQDLAFPDQINYIFAGELPAGLTLDAVSLATPLDTLKTQLHLGRSVDDTLRLPVFGLVGGKGGEVIALGYLLGGLYLWQQRIITWHIPAAFLAAVALLAGVMHAVDPAHHASPWLHLAGGATMIGAFFILTDPCVQPHHRPRQADLRRGGRRAHLGNPGLGRLPHGVAFATLLMNVAAPLIEVYTRSPVFGQRGAGRERGS